MLNIGTKIRVAYEGYNGIIGTKHYKLIGTFIRKIYNSCQHKIC